MDAMVLVSAEVAYWKRYLCLLSTGYRFGLGSIQHLREVINCNCSINFTT